MEGKALPALSAAGLILVLPLLIVLAMLLTSMGSIGQASACTPSQTAGKAFGWPTEKQEASQGWDDGENKHTGLDFDVPKGSKVMAAEDGTVVSVEGDWIKIKHQDDAVQTWYQFFESKSVRVGDEVTRGQEIGKSGEGDEDEPGESGEHLHFELRIRGGENGGGELVPRDPTNELGADSAESSSGCGCGTGGPLVGGNNQEKAFNFFASNGYSKEQAAGIVGNMIHESGVEPARLQSTPPGQITHASAARGSSLGWGIVQWTPAGKMINPSMEATGNDEAKVESLEWQLEFLAKQLLGEGPLPEGPAGDKLRAAGGVDEAAVAFGRYFERFAGSQDVNNPEYAERKATAREVFATFGDGAAAGGGGGCGAGNGDIVATAKMLAWDTPGHGKYKSDAKPEYQEAMPKWNGSTGTDEFSDCGVFVATVMRMSGADPDYPVRGTMIQEPYLRSSGKYDVFDNITEDELQPGDILIGPGHTYLYVGEFNGYNSASASLHGHVPEATNTYGIGTIFAAARLKNAPAPQSD
ncbi:Peptidase M23 [Kribbella flavida DSM 17836]|uniref:Peptidase M23 n=1 Tax=Kribbella flavida (strain DSM 17836 / JCM 10339 / NBRC 14399) TaxID=479435 RepID=D2Q2G8_KRIFD|nr:phage tail tip lysozyme [Kribbella flavida]ADB35864.1 Peptidase M23 [Kribbella flavida DSM 17836]